MVFRVSLSVTLPILQKIFCCQYFDLCRCCCHVASPVAHLGYETSL